MLCDTPTSGRFRGGRLRGRPYKRLRRSRSDFMLYLWRLREFGPCTQFLRDTSAEGGHFHQPAVMYRGRRFPAWNKRVGTLIPVMRFQWRD